MTYDAYRDLSITVDAKGIATVTMNRPERLNAVRAIMHRELSLIFRALHADPAVRVVVLTGTGRAFCAGGDLDWMQEMIDDPTEFQRSAAEAKEIILSMLDCEKPIIAKVNGHAVGLGASLALFSDLIFASSKARIGDPHVLVGLVAADGGSIIWPQLIGYARAKEYLLTGDLLTTETAANIGLINRAVEPDALDQLVQSYAERLAAGAQQAIRGTKASINIGLKQLALSIVDAALGYEIATNTSRDHQEAVTALKERRTAVFS